MSVSAPSKNPWTAIILLNEEYFIALQEQVKLRDQLLSSRLPIIRIVGRKTQFGEVTKLPHKPWERYTWQDQQCLIYDYNSEEHDGAFFDIQDQAKRDRQRGLYAVYLDCMELQFDEEGRFPLRACFNLTRVPRGSQSHREIRTFIQDQCGRYGLYSKMRESIKGRAELKKMLSYPSCLELDRVFRINPKPFQLKDVSDRYLDGLTKQSQDFLWNLAVKTGYLVNCAYKVPTQTSGYLLDGLVRPPTP